ncbi:MAG: hypothetical protein ABIQ93_10295, partial [Saprospiraceae bacterium]
MLWIFICFFLELLLHAYNWKADNAIPPMWVFLQRISFKNTPRGIPKVGVESIIKYNPTKHKAQTERQTDRQTERQTDRQTDRQTERQT